METIDINKFLFSRTKAEKKLKVLDRLSGSELRKVTNETMLRIYNECRGDRDRFYINSDRRAGNDWNSTIEFIYEYKGRAYVCLYVQNSSTDSSECVSYGEFNGSTKYRGYCDRLTMFFTYNSEDIANVIRCILKEYVYYKYIEKDERERAERIRKTLCEGKYGHICDEFYTDWRCWYEDCFHRPRTDRYYRAKNAVENYFTEHIDELYGKPADELQTLIRKIFRETD